MMIHGPPYHVEIGCCYLMMRRRDVMESGFDRVLLLCLGREGQVIKDRQTRPKVTGIFLNASERNVVEPVSPALDKSESCSVTL